MRNSNWNANRQTNIINGDPKPVLDQMDYGFSVGGPVGRPGGQNKLFFYFNLEANPRTFGGDVNRYRVPTRARTRRAISRSRATINGNLYPYVKDPLIAGTCSAADTTSLLPGRRRRRPHSREPSLSERREHPEVVAHAEHRPAGRAGIQLRERRSRGRSPWLSARHSRRLPADVRRCGAASSSSSTNSRARSHPGTIPGFNDTQEHDYGIWLPAGTVQLDDELDDVPRSVVRRQLPPSGGMLDYRRRAELLPHRSERDLGGKSQRVGVRRHPVSLP